MKARPYVPLLAKVLGWLLLHLLILALAFLGFLVWQSGLGLDSLLSGSAGERLRGFGDAVRNEVSNLPASEWNAAILPLAREKNVSAAIFEVSTPRSFPFPVPANVLERAKTTIPPQPARRGSPPAGAGGRPPERGFLDDPGPPPSGDFGERPPFDDPRPGDQLDAPRSDEALPANRPAFLLRGENGDGYWAGVHLVFLGPPGKPHRHELLLIRAETLDGSGMFFDFKPWLWGGLAVLALSLAFWTPFVWGITRYIRRLTTAADLIAAGHFDISLPTRGQDELANLGHAIETMAGRLDHLISGQKRFLGDAAHELCAPLARLRTGFGILEMKLAASQQVHLASIESDAQELATLVEEILSFSRTGSRPPQRQVVVLDSLIREVAARESGERAPRIDVPHGLTVTTDRALLTRALGNLARNAKIHAGADAEVSIEAVENGAFVEITVTDDGPGVAPDELTRLFEPFYRPDRSRSRDTGGSGLGLAIVRTAVETCGGEVVASLPPAGGFAVMIRLERHRPEND